MRTKQANKIKLIKNKTRQKTRLNLSILQISLQFVWALSLFYMSLFIFIVQHTSKSPNGTKHCCRQQEDDRLRHLPMSRRRTRRRKWATWLFRETFWYYESSIYKLKTVFLRSKLDGSLCRQLHKSRRCRLLHACGIRPLHEFACRFLSLKRRPLLFDILHWI